MPATAPARATLTALIDWAGDGFATGANDDVSGDAKGPPGAEIVRVHQPISLITGAAGPSQLILRLRNPTGIYTPGNASSPIAANLIPGKRIRIEATPVAGGGVRGVFDGWVRRITPHGGQRGDRFVTVTAEDALFKASRRKYTADPLTTRALHAWRTEIVTALGFTAAGNRDIATGGGTRLMPVTQAYERNMLDLLNELSVASGAIHYVYASDVRATGAIYRSRGRLATFYGNASVATYTALQIASSEGFEIGDETLANRAGFDVSIIGVLRDVELYRLEGVSVGAGETRTIWADVPTPAFSIAATYTAAGVTVTTTLQTGGRRIKIDIVSAGGPGTVTELIITGTVAGVDATETIEVEDTASIAALGEWEAPSLSSSFYSTPDAARSRVAHVINRFKNGTQLPQVMIDGIYPDVFTRLPGDRVIISNGELGIVAMPLIIGSRTITMRTGGYWSAEWECERAPATKTLFTIGGSAAQGVAGTGVLED